MTLVMTEQQHELYLNLCATTWAQNLPSGYLEEETVQSMSDTLWFLRTANEAMRLIPSRAVERSVHGLERRMAQLKKRLVQLKRARLGLQPRTRKRKPNTDNA